MGLLALLLEELEKTWGEEVRRILDNIRRRDPIEILIRTVLSQNTSDKNAEKAFFNLKEMVKGRYEKLMDMDPTLIEEAIKPAGIYRIRAQRIISLVRTIYERYGGDLSWIKKLSLKHARRELLNLPGIGYKTADIMLAFYGGKDILPVDTHISRIAIRLGYANKRNYEAIRINLEKEIERGKKALAHLLLIRFGRTICKSRRPLCSKCPIKKRCPYALRQEVT